MFAEPRKVSSISDCHFYHSIDIPDHGHAAGDWDLRGRENEYLGGVDLAGKTVLEIGTANGYLCFWMERQGAHVTAYDLSDEHEWDLVPYASINLSDLAQGRRAHIRSINNAWWFAHERFKSKARVAYGTAYDVSDRLGRFDVVTLSCILLHLRDPFLAMQRAASAAADTLIVTDRAPADWPSARANDGRVVRFLPDAHRCEPLETWWQLTPEFVAETLRVLGFGDVTTVHHQQRCQGNLVDLFTIVARRSAAAPNRAQPAVMQPPNDSYGLHDEILGRIPARQIVRHLTGRVWKKLR